MLKIIHFIVLFLFMSCMLGDFDDNVPLPTSLDKNDDKGFRDFTGNKKQNDSKKTTIKVKGNSKKQNNISVSKEKLKSDGTGLAVDIIGSGSTLSDLSSDDNEKVDLGTSAFSNKNKNKNKKSISKKSGILSAELFGEIEKNPSCIRKSKNDYIFFKVKLQLADDYINGKCRVILDNNYGKARFCLKPQDKNLKVKLGNSVWIGSSRGSVIKCNEETMQKDNTIVVWFFYLRKDYEGDTINLVFKDWNGIKEPVLTINLGQF